MAGPGRWKARNRGLRIAGHKCHNPNQLRESHLRKCHNCKELRDPPRVQTVITRRKAIPCPCRAGAGSGTARSDPGVYAVCIR